MNTAGVTSVANSVAVLASVLMFGKVIFSPNEPPKEGANAHDFELKDISGQPHRLGDALAKGKGVVVFLRGYCDGQCPDSARQMTDFVSQAEKFKSENTTVFLIYPGPADGLSSHAREFLGSTALPDNVLLVLDADFTVSSLYHLRWNKDGETVYPATFLLDERYQARFSKVSRTHGDRATAAQVLDALKRWK